MPKEIKFSQKNATYGQINGVMRVIGRSLYYPNNNSPQVLQVLSQLKSGGAKLTYSPKWIQIDIFGENTLVKLGNEEFNLSQSSNEEIEQKLYVFYMLQYKKAGFNVEGKEI